MSIEDKFKEFEKIYNDSVEEIKKYQENEDVGTLVNWLLNTDSNPYSYLPDEYASCMNTAEGFSFLCGVLHHALIDDGDVTFFSVDGKPQIEFVWEHDLKDYKEYKRKKYKIVEVDGQKTLTHDIVDSEIVIFKDFYQFIEEIEIYETNDLKRCYLGDREIMGEEFALEHYSKYKRFDHSWVELEKKEYEL